MCSSSNSPGMAQLGSNRVFPEAGISINSEEEKKLDDKRGQEDINGLLRDIEYEDEKSKRDNNLAF